VVIIMPVIQVTMGKCSREKKKELVERLTATAMEITNIPASEFTVAIMELDYDNLGRHGKTLTDLLADKK
jgi:4-oxalocrotonate tautomerase